jgi:hypothetical protein
VVLTDLQRRILAIVAQRERITTAELLNALGISLEEFQPAARSLGEARLLLAVVPLGMPGFSPPGSWTVTPHGRDAVHAAEDPTK